MCLRISKDFQAKEGKSWRGPPGVSPRPNLSQGVLEPVSYETALHTRQHPSTVTPPSWQMRTCVANVHSTHSAASPPSSPHGVICCLIFMPLVSIKKSGGEGCKSPRSTCSGQPQPPELGPCCQSPSPAPGDGRWGSRPACLGLLTWVHFPFLWFVFSAAGMRSAPAPRGRWKTASSKI